ncbi:MAG TPA: hypothetical protein VD833_02300 [Vicinamibacterales bacterium]|nr:hypothetical protein [Vicinamibacterales bacterium]
MPDDFFRSAFDTLRSRLQAELDSQLTALEERQAEAIARARQDAETESERRWSARLEETRAEWSTRLETDLAAAMEEAARRSEAEALRARIESEQALAEVRDAAGREWEQRLQDERTRAQQAADHGQEQIDQIRSDLARTGAELARVRQELERAEEQTARRVEDLERERTALAEERHHLEEAHTGAIAALQAERTTLLADRTTLLSDLEHERRRLREVEAARDQALTARAAAAAAFEAARADLDHNRSDAEASLERERARVRGLEASLAETRSALDAARREAREAATTAEAELHRAQAAQTDARVVERQWRVAVVERLLTGAKAMSAARSLSDTLAALVSAASAEAPRAALLIVNGPRLQGWRAEGFAGTAPAMIHASLDDGSAIAEAARTGEAVSTSAAPAPRFSGLPSDRLGLAVPVTVGGHAVAVLYVDDGGGGEAEAPGSWPEAVQLLGRHASACLAHLTAVRTAQAMRAAPVAPVAAAPTATSARSAEEDASARRYARLLVSEIKLYNEGAVRVGREKRDLLQRLRSEIERARRLYEERVPPAVGARGEYFQQELVQTLADGDAALLGEPV